MFSGRGKLESLLLSETVHFPKLALVNLTGVFRFETYSLTAELDIPFPNQLRSAPLDVNGNPRWQ